MAKKLLAFDLGASSGRAILGTYENGKLELRETHRFVNGPLEKPDALYWDYPALVNELITGLKKTLEIEPDLDGIGIDTWGVDYVLFDRNSGKMKRLPYHYRDSRTENVPEKVWQLISPGELYSRTGIQFMMLNTIYQLFVHGKEHPEDFVNAVMLPMPDALAYALGGDMTAEYTEASTSNLLNPITRKWDFDIIDKLKLPRDIFPEVVMPSSIGGTLSEKLQRELNCKAIPIIKVGSHDTASAVAATPAPDNGDWAYLSCGTWALLGAELDEPILTSAAGEAPFTNEGGLWGKIRFLTNIMGSWLLQETRRVWNEAGRNISFSQMEDMARNSEMCKYFINPNDITFLTPGDMPERVRKFCARTEQGVPGSDGEVLRAIYDSLALYFKMKLGVLSNLLDVRYEAFNVVGGGVKDGLLMQLTADALNIPVIAGPVEATATGNLLSQLICLGELSSLSEARQVVKNSVELKKFTPNPENNRRFEAAMEKFILLDR